MSAEQKAFHSPLVTFHLFSMDFLRLFIALPLPESVKQGLQAQQDALKQHLSSDIAWTRPEQWHLTLIFLGTTPTEKLPVIQQAIKRATHKLEPFELSTAGLGTFPSLQRPSVLWLGLGGDIDRLQHLHTRLTQNLSGLFEEERAFKAHITLARIKQFGLGKEVVKAFAETPSPKVWWHVDEVALYSSLLKPTGSEYTQHYKISFNKP